MIKKPQHVGQKAYQSIGLLKFDLFWKYFLFIFWLYAQYAFLTDLFVPLYKLVWSSPLYFWIQEKIVLFYFSMFFSEKGHHINHHCSHGKQGASNSGFTQNFYLFGIPITAFVLYLLLYVPYLDWPFWKFNTFKISFKIPQKPKICSI